MSGTHITWRWTRSATASNHQIIFRWHCYRLRRIGRESKRNVEEDVIHHDNAIAPSHLKGYDNDTNPQSPSAQCS